MNFHSYLLEKQYRAQLSEQSRYTNWNEEKAEQLESAYESSRRMYILKSAFSLVSRSCLKDERNDITINFNKNFKFNNEKVKECILSAVNDCLEILEFALCNRCYLSIDQISKYVSDLKTHLESWAEEYKFKIDQSVIDQIDKIESIHAIHEPIQTKEKEIYKLLSEFGNSDNIEVSKQNIIGMFDEYANDIDSFDFSDAYFEERQHLKNKIDKVFDCGSWDKIPKFE